MTPLMTLIYATLALAVRDAFAGWLDSLRPSSKHERRVAASVETAVRRRMQANESGAHAA